MPTDSENISVIESSYSALKEDVLRMKEGAGCAFR